MLIILVAIFAPVFATITGHGVNQQFRTTGLTPDGLPVGPSRTFLLGTDDQGRDILVRIAYGTRISLGVGVGATLLIVIIGAVLGLAAGYFGGIVDTVVARLIDVVLSLPYLLFAISLVSIVRAQPARSSSSSSPSSAGRRWPASYAARSCRSGRRSTSKRPDRSGPVPGGSCSSTSCRT